EPSRAIVPLFFRLDFLAQNVDNQVLTRVLEFDALDLAEKSVKALPVEQPPRQTDHQTARTPVRQIEMEGEPALHERRRITLEIAPLIGVNEAGGRNPCPRRQCPQRSHIRLDQWTIDRLEFVVLILAHLASPVSSPTLLLPGDVSRFLRCCF